ncbi:3-oxoacyl-[acyl-carrier-protein] reductase FabG-like isoform X2 [Ostrea edulis]|uniref:3-oxoacyl-[acyl-carrier-protein] reductase FabG-like isoform X2 n=1 Tax=Ostrea edulis TaxID=37623 RepID=UPI0024AE98BF|nr:3-oxoacyl-[acyl-carrier-protein] reductase FabG-like isoform X2 [Ostrea edulis]
MASIARLDGKFALITGASSGIGAGAAILFSKLGAEVAITGRNVDNLAKTAAECEKGNGKKPFTFSGDLTNEDFVKRLVKETVNRYGKLDILVNNAGIVKTGTIEMTSLEQYDDTMNINVRAIYHLTMLAVPHLIQTKGNIVNVSSVNGVRSFDGVLPYCMSKSAIDQFTRCTAIVSRALQNNACARTIRSGGGGGQYDCFPGFRQRLLYHGGANASRWR